MNAFSHAVMGVSRHQQDISMQETAAVSLEERLIQAYAKESVGAAAEQREVLGLLHDNRVTSDPAALFELQRRTADYNLHVSLVSTLARKGVGAVETLLRS